MAPETPQNQQVKQAVPARQKSEIMECLLQAVRTCMASQIYALAESKVDNETSLPYPPSESAERSNNLDAHKAACIRTTWALHKRLGFTSSYQRL